MDGVTVSALNSVLKQHLDQTDVLLSDAVAHVGFESEESFRGTEGRTLREHDFVRVGCSVSDAGGDVALVYTCGVPVYRRAPDTEHLKQIQRVRREDRTEPVQERPPAPPVSIPPPHHQPPTRSYREVIRAYRSDDQGSGSRTHRPMSPQAIRMLDMERSPVRNVSDTRRPISDEARRILEQERHRAVYRGTSVSPDPSPVERVFRDAACGENIFVRSSNGDGSLSCDVVTSQGDVTERRVPTMPPTWSLVPFGHSDEATTLQRIERQLARTTADTFRGQSYTVPTRYHL